ncbi:MAG: hypothetical protein ACXQTN_03940 [Methanoculleaceae archaeon]
MLKSLEDHLSGSDISPAVIRRAVRHLKSAERRNLYSDDIPAMRAAEGRWFEAIVYEQVCECARKTESIAGVVMRGADAPHRIGHPRPGQNGLFYSKNGDIVIRGNGQDLAELDLLLVDPGGRVAFGEIITSSGDMKEFEAEIAYKKTLIGYLFGQPNVPFILISSVDVSRGKIVRSLCTEPDNALVVTPGCEELKARIDPASLRSVRRTPRRRKKMISLSALPPRRPFDYKLLHDRRRDRVIREISRGHSIAEMKKGDEIPPLVKKIFFGGLYPSAIRWLVRTYPITIHGRIYGADEIRRIFSDGVLAMDIPDYTPILYMRYRHRREYAKLIPDRTGGFKFQGTRNPSMKGFFIWLEAVPPSVGAGMAEMILTHLMDR